MHISWVTTPSPLLRSMSCVGQCPYTHPHPHPQTLTLTLFNVKAARFVFKFHQPSFQDTSAQDKTPEETCWWHSSKLIDRDGISFSTHLSKSQLMRFERRLVFVNMLISLFSSVGIVFFTFDWRLRWSLCRIGSASRYPRSTVIEFSLNEKETTERSLFFEDTPWKHRLEKFLKRMNLIRIYQSDIPACLTLSMIVSKVFPRAEISSSFIVDGENDWTAWVEWGRSSVTSKDKNTKKINDIDRRKGH